MKQRILKHIIYIQQRYANNGSIHYEPAES